MGRLYVALCVLVVTVSLILSASLYVGTRVLPVVMTPSIMVIYFIVALVVGIFVTSRLIEL